ncbi:unnamed protein product [Caenorhabditis brenneri]
MSDTSVGNTQQLMEQPNEAISKAVEQLSVTDNFDKTSTPPKNLSDMPIDVFASIIESCDYKEQLILRKVSKSLRTLVDKLKPSCTRLSVWCGSDHVVCWFNGRRVEYAPPGTCRISLRLIYSNKSDDVEILTDDFEKIAFDDLAFTLKNPKLQLEFFELRSPHWGSVEGSKPGILEKYKRMNDLLFSINHQISTRKAGIDIVPPSGPLSILPYLKPGTLQKISITAFDNRRELGKLWQTMEQISLLDQWKKAEELELEYGLRVFPMKYTTHFKRFQINEESLDTNAFIRFRDHLCTLENFESCLIDYEDYYDARNVYKRAGKRAPRNECTKYVRHYSIPGSDDYLEMMFFMRNSTITIEKKKK